MLDKILFEIALKKSQLWSDLDLERKGQGHQKCACWLLWSWTIIHQSYNDFWRKNLGEEEEEEEKKL